MLKNIENKYGLNVRIGVTGLVIVLIVLAIGLAFKGYNFYFSSQVRQAKNVTKCVEYLTVSQILLSKDNPNTKVVNDVLNTAKENCPSNVKSNFNLYYNLVESNLGSDKSGFKLYQEAFNSLIQSLQPYIKSSGLDMTSIVYDAGNIVNSINSR